MPVADDLAAFPAWHAAERGFLIRLSSFMKSWHQPPAYLQYGHGILRSFVEVFCYNI